MALSARYPDHSGPHAQEGTRLHDVAAKTLSTGQRIYNEEDAKVVDPYVNDVWDEWRKRPEGELRVEQKARWGLNAGYEGTPDATLTDHANQHVVIWDLKTGWRLVEVEANPQLLSYAVMVVPNKYTVELRIVQPLPHHPDGPVRSWTTTFADLQRRAVDLDKALKETQAPDAPLKTGEHCLYCSALAGCPAARRVSLAAVDKANAPSHDLPREHIGPELEALREAKKILDLRIGALESEVWTLLRGGTPIPGVAMMEGKGGRTNWKLDENVVRVTLQTLLGRDVAVPKMPTPTQLKNSGISPEILKPLTEYKPGKMVITTDVEARALKVFSEEPNMEYNQT